MARPHKRGLDYFPMDIDFFSDIKIRKLIRSQGAKSISIYTYLLCSIYKNGYYMWWDKDLPFIISEITGYDEAYISEVIKKCCAIGLFDGNLFETENVITSKGIQDRYLKVCNTLKRDLKLLEYWLIPPEETEVNSEETEVTTSKSAQRKEKEIKEKESECDNAHAQEDRDSQQPLSNIYPVGLMMPMPNEPYELTDTEIKNVREFIGIQTHIVKTAEYIIEQFNAFKLLNFNGTASYKGRGEITKHFMYWLKKEVLLPTPGGGGNTAEHRAKTWDERLAEKKLRNEQRKHSDTGQGTTA